MRLNKIYFFIPLLWAVSHKGYGQYDLPQKANRWPQINESEQYLFPVNPQKRSSIAGVMGELRGNHFHAGIDIRVPLGTAVLASQNGYVSRISIKTYGYGVAVYIKHPNGHTTVYAHLLRLNKKLDSLVTHALYQRQSPTINLLLTANTFLVMRGDTIAYSGNSGSSSGPHLHFEIRNKENECLNPLLFDMEEVVDHTPPFAKKIAFQTMNMHSRINGRFGYFEFPLTKQKKGYTMPVIQAVGNIGMTLFAYDKIGQSPSSCGIDHISTTVNGEKIFTLSIDKINFHNTRDAITLTGRSNSRLNDSYAYKLYIDNGNTLDYYTETLPSKGILNLRELGNVKEVNITLQDAFKNKQQIFFNLHTKDSILDMKSLVYPKSPSYQIIGNILVVSIHHGNTQNAVFHHQGFASIQSPAYIDTYHQKQIYLWDLRKAIPDSIKFDNFKAMVLKNETMIPSGQAYTYYGKNLDIVFNKNTLYDTIFLWTQYQHTKDTEFFTLGGHRQPLKKSINVTLRPKKKYDGNTSVYYIDKEGNPIYIGGQWKSGAISFSTKSFKTYTLITDTIPPQLIPLKIDKEIIRCRIEDSLSGIRSYKATINEQWLLMHYDYKTNLLWSKRLDSTVPLVGELSIEVIDNTNNVVHYIQQIP